MTILISVRELLLMKYLTLISLLFTISNLNTNGKFDLFYDQIDSVCKVHVPYKMLSKKEVKISSKPWITKEILAKMKYRDKLYSKLLKSKQPNPNLHYIYNKFRNRVDKNLKDSKTAYFNQYFSLNKHNIQKLWSGVRSILNVGKCKNSNITFILNNNKSVDNPKDSADIFNNFFANVGKTTEKGIPPGDVIAHHSTLGVTTRDQFFYPLSLRTKSGHLLIKWMLASLLAHTVYLRPF